MKATIAHPKTTDMKKDIIAALAYFDVFNYPLTKAEIVLFMGNKYENEAFNNALSYLLVRGGVYRFDGFYTLKNDPRIAQRRRTGNAKAAELITIAEKVGQLLIKFPYVRGIAISGSLSKNFADDDSDIDLFIITKANRLWIARTFLHLFKKLTFLVHKEQFFCMNYFIDEAALEIAEKNIFTATEIVTIMPLEGDAAFESFYAANSWTRAYLPNNYMRVSSAMPLTMSMGKRFVETLFNNPFGNALNNLFKQVTAARWNKKTMEKRLNSRGVIMGMEAGKHYAKPNPGNFQVKLIQRYENRVAELLQDGENSLAHV